MVVLSLAIYKVSVKRIMRRTFENAAERALADSVFENEAVVDEDALWRILELVRLIHRHRNVLLHYYILLLFFII